MTAHTPIDYGASNASPRQFFDRNAWDYEDWKVVRDACRFTHSAPVRMVRAPLVAAIYAADDTIMQRVIGAMLDYHSTPQGALEEEHGPDRMRDVAETLEAAASAIRAIADRMEERG